MVIIINIILSLLVCNLILIYFYSISSISQKIFNFKVNKIDQIIIGYSILLITLYYFYFFLKFDIDLINLLIAISSITIFFNLKNFFLKLFITKEVILLNLLLIVILLPALFFGEQFYIFRGNYWDSSNYLSSAILMKNYDYKAILNQNYTEIFHQFYNMERIVTGRPLVNYLISLFLNFKFSAFYTYFFFKCFISILIYLSIFSFLKTFKFIKKKNYNILISVTFIFSFWNYYVFEIDALSHYAAIPILIILIKFIFEKTNLNLISKYTYLTLLSSSLFLLYPEIIFVPIVFFLVEFLFDIKKKKKKEFIIFLISGAFFLIITLPSLETNYAYLLNKQVSQATRPNDWWTYFGSFILGKDNLVTNYEFVEFLKIKINSINDFEFLRIIHNAHFDKYYYFIYLNILPSLLGLYHLLPGKIESTISFLFSFMFLVLLIFYLLKIIYDNTKYILKNNEIKKKFFTILIIFLTIGLFFIFAGNIWSSIKLYTFLFPFIFTFMSISFVNKSVNHIYLFLAFTFFLYKFTIFNNGIGKLDSFPSIINYKIKSNIEWQLPKNIEKSNCKILHLKRDNYIIQAYLNLMLINNQKNYEKNANICKIRIKDKKFELYD